MGRRARSNCSPIDSAMEKYHSDIGNRLSGVFVPSSGSNPQAAQELDVCDAFNMLTLDLRRSSSLRVKTHQQQQQQLATCTPTTTTTTKTDSLHKHTTEDESTPTVMSSQNKDDSAFHQTSNTLPSIQSSHSNTASNKENNKRNIVDKLARALFQRKHTCARCQRRSKSCLQNKTFNVSEKHYTCGRCREASRTMKSLISGSHGHEADAGDNAKNNSDVILPKPRLQANDSGYDTATSCSTVSSSHSNSPYASSNKQTDRPTALEFEGVTRRHDDLTTTTTTTTVAGGNGERSRVDHTTPCLHTTTTRLGEDSSSINTQTTTTTTTPSPSAVHHFMGGAPGEGGVRVLKQVKTRHVQNYDGYLPDHESSPPHLCDLLTLPDPNHHCSVDNTEDTVTGSDSSNTPIQPAGKACYVCATTSRPCFRLPWDDGWLCEDCIDGML